MNTWWMFSSLLISALHWPVDNPVVVQTPATDGQMISVMACRGESSPLVRLACYDQALSPAGDGAGKTVNPLYAGPAWQKAMDQEKTRVDHSTAFLVSAGTGDNPTVVITTPALGVPPPRPVLMLSCVDNITRLQIALNEPQQDGAVTLTADSDRFDVRWFLRENGYVLESSRGLAGIEEIKRLMAARTLTLDGTERGFPRLTFNISQLSQAIVPLRKACHW